MIFSKNRFWFCILIVSISGLGFQFFRPRYDQKFPLQHSLSQQVIELGAIPAATYTLSALYISDTDLTGSPDSKIEVFDLAGIKIYEHVHKNDDLQIIPEFQISERQSLKAKIELLDTNPVAGTALELRLRHQDEPIHFRIFWFGVVGLLLSISALGYLRKRRSL